MEHELKCWPLFFRAVVDGSKRFELRRMNGREFNSGDTLLLREYSPAKGEGLDGHYTMRGTYTGRWCRAEVTYTLIDPAFLLMDVICMAIRVISYGHTNCQGTSG